MSPDNVALEYDPFSFGDIPFICQRNMDRLDFLTKRFRHWCDELHANRFYYESLKSSELAPLYSAYGLIRNALLDMRRAESEVADLRSELLYVLLPDYYFVRV